MVWTVPELGTLDSLSRVSFNQPSPGQSAWSLLGALW